MESYSLRRACWAAGRGQRTGVDALALSSAGLVSKSKPRSISPRRSCVCWVLVLAVAIIVTLSANIYIIRSCWLPLVQPWNIHFPVVRLSPRTTPSPSEIFIFPVPDSCEQHLAFLQQCYHHYYLYPSTWFPQNGAAWQLVRPSSYLLTSVVVSSRPWPQIAQSKLEHTPSWLSRPGTARKPDYGRQQGGGIVPTA